jgi:GNAT superfamily N-acetyltransferase
MGTSYGRTLDLADIEVERSMQGQGAFRALLEHAEPLAARYGLAVYAESIISDIARQALARRGYEFFGVQGGSGWLSHAELCRRYPGSSPVKSD